MICGRTPQSHVDFPAVPAAIGTGRTSVRGRSCVASFTSQPLRHSVLVSVGFSLQEKG